MQIDQVGRIDECQANKKVRLLQSPQALSVYPDVSLQYSPLQGTDTLWLHIARLRLTTQRNGIVAGYGRVPHPSRQTKWGSVLAILLLIIRRESAAVALRGK